MKKLKIELAGKEKQLQQLEMDKKTLSDEAIRVSVYNIYICYDKQLNLKQMDANVIKHLT